MEGHGEVAAVPLLLERIWYDLLSQTSQLECLRPIRQPRERLVRNKDEALTSAIELAAAKLKQAVAGQAARSELILLILDADRDPPCILGPRLQLLAEAARHDQNISCVLANVEFETWFVAAAKSLSELLDLDRAELPPDNPERARQGKAWVQRHIRGLKYSESVDQVRLTARLDLATCRTNSPSFDKLCREIERFAGDVE
ncbi:MAG: DUF4276 family protein [Pirellulaceae bacterium]|nr:DUF4276 family protein [Pirellulaceae bacterium]